MGFHKIPFSVLYLYSILLTQAGLFVFSASAADLTSLVYKGCANQNFQDPSGVLSQNLKTLLSTLVQQSAQKNFYSTTIGDGQNAILGLYQCRGDLSTIQCYNCVSRIPDMANKLCGKAMAVRVQLTGCYLRYEASGFKQVPETELLFKICGSTRMSEAGFEERRDTAFDMVVNGVKNGSLFYTGTYESVYVLGQCDGDLSNGDCGDCVKSALDDAKSQCGNSISAQIYLHKCYISYSYYPNGVPNTPSETDVGTNQQQQHTQRTVAIAVGGVAAFGFAIVCLMFLRSMLKKKRSSKHGDY
ncbi:cysteine-rich repeat secretory protein 56 isoform X2 [Tripterygium wilfordii]|uniref:Cysteine-rich repeat secretory protein 56 isoform X2 n=1 Tax=Tripterygium wilfordii TaxID=458696 RepID=A0A7J7CY98_TRIWF|nr:plasmodesmata-located protein 2-like [Tripterygium wilfordii]KAF5738988.1 cysteine-rich repeat secretory protein 56 isoform X2 [Tripterygium wilfordii]